jgi:hypothetical protein
VVEEGEHLVAVDILDCELARGLSLALGSEVRRSFNASR